MVDNSDPVAATNTNGHFFNSLNFMTKHTYSGQNMGESILHWEDGPPPRYCGAKCTQIYEGTCQGVICTCQNFFSSLTWLKESLFRVSSRCLQKVITSQGCQTQQCTAVVQTNESTCEACDFISPFS